MKSKEDISFTSKSSVWGPWEGCRDNIHREWARFALEQKVKEIFRGEMEDTEGFADDGLWIPEDTVEES